MPQVFGESMGTSLLHEMGRLDVRVSGCYSFDRWLSASVWHSSCSRKRVLTRSCILSLFLCLPGFSAQSQLTPRMSPNRVFSDTTLGFRYSEPDGMSDDTKSGRTEIHSRAAASGTTNTLDLLLAMTSGADSTALQWRSLTIESYPRDKFSNLADAAAEAKMAAWVAGVSNQTANSRSVRLAGQDFVVSVFGQQIGSIRKAAVIWTTTRRGKLLSFAFVANSPTQLQKLAESMKSVSFY